MFDHHRREKAAQIVISAHGSNNLIVCTEKALDQER
jgi:hypothetical protein